MQALLYSVQVRVHYSTVRTRLLDQSDLNKSELSPKCFFLNILWTHETEELSVRCVIHHLEFSHFYMKHLIIILLKFLQLECHRASRLLTRHLLQLPCIMCGAFRCLQTLEQITSASRGCSSSSSADQDRCCRCCSPGSI